MAFRLLKRLEPSITPAETRVGFALQTEFGDRPCALDKAKELCKEFGWTVIVVEDMDEVSMAPMVISHSPPAPPAVVYRGLLDNEPRPGVDEPARPPQSKPRLLVIPDRRATGAEIVKYLMVVAEGKIVKNAFGGLDVDDMPLTDEERKEVTNALQGT